VGHHVRRNASGIHVNPSLVGESILCQPARDYMHALNVQCMYV
jgi:hypothetical protein